MKLSLVLVAWFLGVHARGIDTIQGLVPISLLERGGGGTGGGDTSDAGAAQRLLQSIVDLNAEGAGVDWQQLVLRVKAKPGAMLQEIDALTQNIMQKIVASHTAAKAELKHGLDLIDACRGPGRANDAGVSATGIRELTKKALTAYRKVKKCRKNLVPWKEQWSLCIDTVRMLHQASVAQCTAYNEGNMLSPDAASSCEVAKTGETHMQWLQRMIAYTKKEQAALKRDEEKCKKATRAIKLPKQRCAKHTRKFQEEAKKCNTDLHAKLMKALEILKAKEKSMCSTYRTCYHSEVKAYHNVVARMKPEVDVRKMQWQHIKRVECLVGAHDGTLTKIDGVKLQGCIDGGTASTTHLNITYHAVHQISACSTSFPGALQKEIEQDTDQPAPHGKIIATQWTHCLHESPQGNACHQRRYTMLGQKFIDPSYNNNRKHCCVSHGEDGCKEEGFHFKCVLFESTSPEYDSGRCTARESVERQCSRSADGYVLGQKSCVYEMGGTRHYGVRAMCKSNDDLQ